MPLNRKTIEFCRTLRRNQTPCEQQLWTLLRNRKLAGLKFLRQHPFAHGGTLRRPEIFVADFYCAEKNLVVELDGKIHETQVGYDRNRDKIMKEMGLNVLRIKNEEMNDPDAVLKKILNTATHPRPSLLRREGGYC
jgi:very-short-patch-repair endonuclease